MPLSMRQAVISCLYKNGEREDIRNWRPISLLNYDYKIYTKIIANKIQPTLKTIIHNTQTAAVPKRTIIENLQINRDIISFANLNNLEASIIALDQEKAFDKVDWNFLFKTIEKIGYGENIIKKIKTVYSNIEAQIKINGHLSKSFLLKRGVRQGCPLSMILYIMVAEVFLENIRQNKKIKGLKVNDTEIKTTAFADDTTVYLGSNESIKELGKQLSIFEEAVGVTYNKDKCVGMWLGKNRNKEENPLGFKWNSKKN